jgi:hypothetical protein
MPQNWMDIYHQRKKNREEIERERLEKLALEGESRDLPELKKLLNRKPIWEKPE